ncbi:MAG: hypothetical protein HC903_02290 [Methylacidiphilales bacterium]|nr:hypothetical protein [Candidatus Methylacidiphilales bacterium]NJR16707.1 hypothetical protein [Calothrix sp. CSU_2_0]
MIISDINYWEFENDAPQLEGGSELNFVSISSSKDFPNNIEDAKKWLLEKGIMIDTNFTTMPMPKPCMVQF